MVRLRLTSPMAVKKKAYKPKTIDVENFTDRRNSAFSLGVTEEILLEAVAVVGAVYEDVRKHLQVYRTPYFYRKDRGLRS